MSIDARGFLHSTLVESEDTLGTDKPGGGASMPPRPNRRSSTARRSSNRSSARSSVSAKSGKVPPRAQASGGDDVAPHKTRDALGHMVQLDFGNGHTQHRIIRSTGLPHSHETDLTSAEKEAELHRT